MQNFLNSPAGPLGGAGQASTSTQPQNLFSNAGSFGNKFGAGIERFKNNLGAFSPDRVFGQNGPMSNLFGGDGGILGGLRSIPGNVGQIPQNLASIFTRQQPQANAPTGVPGQAGNSSGGFLSRFMQGNQNG